tara:strand:- start:842 stop:1267 length:426 start_codon:yes stop_codon:yes gene_type:complete
MANSSENIKNYSITLLCVIASAFIIFLGFYLKTTSENKALAQKEVLSKVEEKVDKVYNDYKSLVDRQIMLQERIEENANNAGILFNEGALIFSVRLMESEKMIDPAQADMMVIEAISEIKKANPRIADIVSTINRKYINSR